MADIYQQIWDADQAGSGLQPLFADGAGVPDTGYVRVDRRIETSDANPPGDFKVIPEAHIPPAKAKTYDLCKALFDNYALSEAASELETPAEREEVHDLLQAMVDTAPMLVARSYVEAATGTTISKERWYGTLLEMWFRRFSSGGDPELSGFEHVVVGEQEGSKIQGYHFWYKYYLDDGFAEQVQEAGLLFPGLHGRDRIVYIRNLAERDQGRFPESVTLSYRWDAPDYDAKAIRPLIKPKGGFFVGCSVEGLLALGTVRAHLGARAPKEAIINGARYAMALYRSPNEQHVRTFYPVFKGPADDQVTPIPTSPPAPPVPTAPPPPPLIVTGPIRIVAALVNPFGADPGTETVTLVNTGPERISLDGWRLVDRNNNHYEIKEVVVGGGSGVTIMLPPNTMQLSNKGGDIRLVDRTGQTVHRVSYSRAQASREGETIIF